MPQPEFLQLLQWDTQGIPLSEHQLLILLEIFTPISTHDQYTVTLDGFNLGKTRTLIANQDALRPIIMNYVNSLSYQACLRLGDLIDEWEGISTKTYALDEAERVKFRSGEPEEHRLLIKKRIQTYIPVFTDAERNNYLFGDTNIIQRG